MSERRAVTAHIYTRSAKNDLTLISRIILCYSVFISNSVFVLRGRVVNDGNLYRSFSFPFPISFLFQIQSLQSRIFPSIDTKYINSIYHIIIILYTMTLAIWNDVRLELICPRNGYILLCMCAGAWWWWSSSQYAI